MNRKFFVLVSMGLGLGLNSLSLADGIYTYVDRDGKRVYTNVVPGAGPMDQPIGASLQKARALPRTKTKWVPERRLIPTTLTDKIVSLVEKYDLKRFNLGPEFVQAVIKVESNFDPNAISKKGALGLMQLMPETARRFKVRNVFDPDQNLEGGIQYLNFLLETFHGDVNLTLAAYNAGENVVQRLRNVPPYRETREYVKRVGEILGDSKPIPLYDASHRTVTYVAWVAGKLQFSNIDPPASAIVFDGYHLPHTAALP